MKQRAQPPLFIPTLLYMHMYICVLWATCAHAMHVLLNWYYLQTLWEMLYLYLIMLYLSSPIYKTILCLQKRLLDKQQDTATKKAKLSTSIAYKHSSVVPRDSDVQNFRIFVGKFSA